MPAAAHKNCFVIMPMSDAHSPADNKWTDLYENHIKAAVEQAGYACHRSLNPTGSFMHNVVKHLITAEVVIAVLTELRPNVMYELGARNALKGRTIMLVEDGSAVPSDLGAYIALRYSTRTAASREALTVTIRDRLAHLDHESPSSDNPIFDNLMRAAQALMAEWYEKENPSTFRPRLRQLLPDYVLTLERVWREMGPVAIDDPRGPLMVGSPIYPTQGEAERQASMMWANRGTELKTAHDLEGALHHFEIALQLDPGNVLALGNRTLVLVMMGRHDAVAESIRMARSVRPASAPGWNALGKTLLAQKDFAAAADAFRHALALDSQSAIYANNAGFALELGGAHEEALHLYAAAEKLNPGLAHALYNRGRLLKQLGREVEAAALIQRAAAIDPRIEEEIEAQREGLSV
jgi:tetratricopeptide (TPR) repeat protein